MEAPVYDEDTGVAMDSIANFHRVNLLTMYMYSDSCVRILEASTYTCVYVYVHI